jgi:hypothetical protein
LVACRPRAVKRHTAPMRFGRSPAVITSLQRASPWICFVAARRLHAWGPIGPPEKEKSHAGALPDGGPEGDAAGRSWSAPDIRQRTRVLEQWPV